MRISRQQAIIIALAVLTAVIWLSAFLSDSKTLEVTFLDVGDGMCAVVRSPAGRVMVVDCGTSSWRNPEQVGDKLVAPYLQRMGIDEIDVAVLSHPHADHVSGYADLLRFKPAKLILATSEEDENPYYWRFIKQIRASKAIYRRAKRGQILDLGGGAVAQVLNPEPQRKYEDLNNSSIVLRITYGSSAIVIAADAGTEAEMSMLCSDMSLRAQVLQVGHHGSDSASSPEFLAAIKPQIAIIPCARRSRYQHPSPEIVRRLESVGARIYTTGENGAVVVSTDGCTLRVRSMR